MRHKPKSVKSLVGSIVVLISGRGSNLQSILQTHLMCEVAAVISNRADAGGLQLAEQHRIPTAVVSHKDYPDRAAFDAVLAATIDRYQPDLVVLAGFMRILTPGFTRHYEGRMLNIHPSLLAAFPGLHTHERAIEAGCRFAGATVHFVTAELDHGPMVAQAVVPVLDGDDAGALAGRVLKLEHRMYPAAVRWFVSGQLAVEGARVRQLAGESQSFS